MKVRGNRGAPLLPVCTDPRQGKLLASYDGLDGGARAELGVHTARCPVCGPRWQVLRAAEAWLERGGDARRSAAQRRSAPDAAGPGTSVAPASVAHPPTSGARSKDRAARATRGRGSPVAPTPASPCPRAEDLYDFGRGPGSRPLARELHASITRHVAGCAACQSFTATLAVPIPVPIEREAPGVELDSDEDLEPGEDPVRRAVSGRGRAPRAKTALPSPDERALARRKPFLLLRGESERTWPIWAALATAAALLLFVLRFFDGETSRSREFAGIPRRFPDAQVLRGRGQSPLVFPRDRVLAAPAGSGTLRPLVFEILPEEDASAYRVALRRHAGGAFDAGHLVVALTSDSTRLDAPDVHLEPGAYTWEAWAVVHGLDRPLGERDFEVAVDEDLYAEWQRLEREDEPERSERRLALLHERGYLGDARAFARELPASAERDRYLDALPGR